MWACALQLMGAVAASWVEANTITYTAGISACKKAEKWVRALQLLGGIANIRVEADTITYNAAIRERERARERVRESAGTKRADLCVCGSELSAARKLADLCGSELSEAPRGNVLTFVDRS